MAYLLRINLRTCLEHIRGWGMDENSILVHCGTMSWNRQTVDSTTFFATKFYYMEIFQEQFAGLVMFSFTLTTRMSIIEARFFLDAHTQCIPNTFDYLFTLSVPVSYQHPTSPYITRTKKTFDNEKKRIDQTED